MAVFTCKMCGAPLQLTEGQSVVTCAFCDAQQTLPHINSDRIADLYERAGQLRRSNDFDRATQIYQEILHENPKDAEAHWSLVLCKFGIMYVEDPYTQKRIPTINRTQTTSLLADADYQAALNYADANQRIVYEKDANTIEQIRRRIMTIVAQEEPYDIFICYKDKDPTTGKATQDRLIATEYYNRLTRENFKVFFAHVTLDDKLGHEYEPYIFAALQSAKVMIVLGTKPEYFEAPWVRNEWSRYYAMIRAGAKKTLIPAFRDMDAYDLPPEMRVQAMDMSKIGFVENLVVAVRREVERNSQSESEPVAMHTADGVNVTSLLKRVSLFLEDGDWDNARTYCEKVLDIDPENAEAYLGKLLADLRIKTREQLKGQRKSFDKNPNFQKAIRFADAQLSATLQSFADAVNQAYWESIYVDAKRRMESADSESQFKDAHDQFSLIAHYRDAGELAKKCLEMAQEMVQEVAERKKKEDICQRAKEYIHYADSQETRIDLRIDFYKQASELLSSIAGYPEADDLLKQCQEVFLRIEEAKKVKKRVKIGWIVFLSTVALIVLGIVVGNIINNAIEPQRRAERIEQCYQEGNYKELVQKFGIVDIVIPEGTTSIADKAFMQCSQLKSVVIPDSVTSIGNSAFDACSSLTSITIPDSVTSIGQYAFAGCSSLTSITIPDSVTSIGTYAFSDCTSLSSVTLSNGITSISSSAFWNCWSLSSIVIPNGVQTIDSTAFCNCSSLKNITIPQSVKTIGVHAFRYCESLSDVYYTGTEEEWKQIDIDNQINGNADFVYAKKHYNYTP